MRDRKTLIRGSILFFLMLLPCLGEEKAKPGTSLKPISEILKSDGTLKLGTGVQRSSGDGTTSTAQNPSHAFRMATSKSVTPTATNASGSNSTTKMVTAGAALSVTSLTSDFKIAPDTSWFEGSYSYNVSVASDPDNGFLVTWRSEYQVGSSLYDGNFACRISKTGEILDTVAIPLSPPVWKWCVPSAVFVGGNWIVVTNKDYMYEWVGAQRVTPSGVVLDDPPVNICNSIGKATILYPAIATNGQVILCVTGIGGNGLQGSIFDPDLNILVDRFLILSGADDLTPYRVAANGNNFVITFKMYDYQIHGDLIKLVIVSPEGQVLSIQNVNGEWDIGPRGSPTITTFNNTDFVTYFDTPTLWGRRYSADGNPIDSSPVSIIESPDFAPILQQLSYGVQSCAYTDLFRAGNYFFLFWPRIPEGMSSMGFKTDLSIRLEPIILDSQAQCKLRYDPYGYSMSNSIIRAASIGNKVLTVWIDGREGDGRVYGNLFEVGAGKVDFLATWDGQGVYFRNSETGNWFKLASPADLIAAGDLDGDGKDDLIGTWPGQGGVWVRYSKTGGWAKLSTTAKHLAAGDMNGDARVDLVGTWDGQGVYYRDSISGAWIKMASPATLITSGDIDGDNIDDLIGIWPSQGGVWVKYSSTGGWSKLSSTARDIASGDMNGDGRDDLLATWDGQGVFYRNSLNGSWVKMATPADQVTCGDIDGDGVDDLIGIWAGQGGVWAKHSSTGSWVKLSSTAKDIATGKMRSAEAMVLGVRVPFPGPQGGYTDGPESLMNFKDLSKAGPGGSDFLFQQEPNLIPQEKETVDVMRIPGPEEPNFRWIEEKNLVPQESLKKSPKNIFKR